MSQAESKVQNLLLARAIAEHRDAVAKVERLGLEDRRLLSSIARRATRERAAQLSRSDA